MFIYIFGSVCRGEIDCHSDIDLLLITDKSSDKLDSKKYSIYSPDRIKQLWSIGNPFAWHLFLESKLVYSYNNSNFIKNLGCPNKYNNVLTDCLKFYAIFHDAVNTIKRTNKSEIFELSNIFLAIRNFAICYSLYSQSIPNFSRDSALKLTKNKLTIELESYRVLERSRILCTRGEGCIPNKNEIELAISSIESIDIWMKKILNLLEDSNNVRI
ncbi:nucleotidyltransferase domain-containing protein [Proteus mirabilis]|uniref:nucleotidyltransferase domain-containing protein n=1 Tax=Proteus mirabilis TaxID=584 RepID=UPI0018C4B9B9|nr:nucleotidyltransferase domain-containing protein [Proteus mirabilis]ELA9901855.1 nucleotidyltransferase domain-containing protein [Proteus mirabilis]MBG5973169.1 nucleotidyltransferase domain-containing protein [Proteus mirabilis]MBI6272225.1 nucleotidyltransferase domain-containing protein [Proteus mirabilis]